MKALVTGGGGFIGSNLCRALLRRGHQVLVLDNFSTGKRENLADIKGEIEIIEGTICSGEDVAKALEGVQVVFHQAALPSVQRSIKDPLRSNEVNVHGTLNLLWSSLKRGVQRFIYASSSSVYGDTPTLPKHEEMPVFPVSPYGVSKLAAEQYCLAFYRSFRLPAVCLRYFNVFGPYQDPENEYAAVIPKFVSLMSRGEAATIFGDGEQSRDFTYIDNVVEGNLRALEAPEAAGHVFNVCTGAPHTVNEVASQLREIIGCKAGPVHLPPRTGEIRHSHGANEKARKILEFSPSVGFREGLEKTVNWLTSATSSGKRGKL